MTRSQDDTSAESEACPPPTVDSGAPPPTTEAVAAANLGVKVKQLLGEGGMGSVYLAFDASLQRDVAIKVLSGRLAAHETFQRSFIKEARTVARLQHPSIVPVHGIAIDSGGTFAFSMQAVEGENFHNWLRARRKRGGALHSLAAGLEVLLKVCDALAYAHSRGVLHCDIKPENVMVGGHGRVYLMDWGLSRSFDHDPPTGLAGTPAYMAPEQARCEVVDERADVFGVGAMLFELITGEPPYGQVHLEEAVQRAVSGNVSDITQLVDGMAVSRRICRVATKAVEPNPEDRYQSVSELRRAIHDFLRAGFHLPRQAYLPGALIVKEGDVERTAYMIISGRCRVFRTINGQEVPLRTLGPGDIFGELALLLEEPRSASVVVEQDCTVLVIDEDTLEASGAMEGWTAALMRALAQRFRDLESTTRP